MSATHVITVDPTQDRFARLVEQGAYLGKGKTTGRRSVLVFVFPTADGAAADVSVHVHNATAESRQPIPPYAVARFVESHLRMFGTDVHLSWELNPAWGMRSQGRRSKRAKAATGRVYFVRDEQGFIKIGFTSNLANRITTLKTASRQQLELLGSMPGSLDDEAALHQRFADSRVRGEWFRPSSELRSYIRSCAEANAA